MKRESRRTRSHRRGVDAGVEQIGNVGAYDSVGFHMSGDITLRAISEEATSTRQCDHQELIR